MGAKISIYFYKIGNVGEDTDSMILCNGTRWESKITSIAGHAPFVHRRIICRRLGKAILLHLQDRDVPGPFPRPHPCRPPEFLRANERKRDEDTKPQKFPRAPRPPPSLTDNFRRHPHRHAPLGQILYDQAPRPDLTPVPDLNVSQQTGPRPDEDPPAHLGMSVRGRPAASAQGDVVEDGAGVADDGGLPHDDAGAVVQHEAAAQVGAGVDVDLEGLGGAALEVVREDLASVVPEVVGHPIGLEGVESLEIEKDVGETGAGGIPVPHRAHVQPQAPPKIGGGLQRLQHQAHHLRRHHPRPAELVRQMKRQRALQGLVRQDGGVHVGHQEGLPARLDAGLQPEGVPDAVEGRIGVHVRGGVG
mmetsp:Transcript_21570/g.49031  ORF Transcript_21570/g.49031 Transcript_21570/m.49031 type:complete len:361 (+) Transcript_21570:327-1409(+)